MQIFKKGKWSAHEARTSDYYIQNDETGGVVKSFGYSTERGRMMAQKKAEAFTYGMHAKDCLNANRAIVAENRCPTCGKGIRRNLSLTGWWQCEQFGTPQFRKDAELPHCNWQCFTE